MPLLKIQRYKTNALVFRDYFVTGPSYAANSQSVVTEISPSLVSLRGEYAVFRTTGTITGTLTPVGPTATWVGGSHPSGYTLSAPFVGSRTIGGVLYNCILVTVT